MAHPSGHQIPIWMRVVLGCNNAANKFRRLVSQRLGLRRIKRHWRRWTGIAGKDFSDAVGEPHVTIEPAFEFDQDRCPPADEIAQLAERHHTFGAVAKWYPFELG